MGTERPWPKTTLVREEGFEKVESLQTGKEAKRAVRWEYQDYIPASLLREELETAWLRGFRAFPGAYDWDSEVEPLPEEVAQQAADYAERVVGGSTRPERPEVKGV